MKLLVITALLLGISFSSLSQELNVGDKAPVFSTVADNGLTWNVNDYLLWSIFTRRQ